MNKFILIILCCLMISASGCARNYYNVPTDNLADRVKILGVVPIMVDADSDIIHPQKDLLLSLIAEKNRSYEGQFVRKLKTTGNFYAVALMNSEPDDLFKKLLFRREQRDDATVRYNKYFWKNDELKQYIQQNNLDAVMLIVVSGLTDEAKISSSNLLNSLTSNYNFLIMTAQIIDASGTILWEYPNFRQRILTYYPMINLQYPDFSESEANKSAITAVKFKTIDGIKRTLDQKRSDILLRDTQEPEVYTRQFDEMISLLKFDAEKVSKGSVPVPASATPSAAPVPAPPMAAPAPPKVIPAPPETPSVTRVPVLPAPATTVPAPATPQPPAPPVEIVPATGSTL